MDCSECGLVRLALRWDTPSKMHAGSGFVTLPWIREEDQKESETWREAQDNITALSTSDDGDLLQGFVPLQNRHRRTGGQRQTIH